MQWSLTQRPPWTCMPPDSDPLGSTTHSPFSVQSPDPLIFTMSTSPGYVSALPSPVSRWHCPRVTLSEISHQLGGRSTASELPCETTMPLRTMEGPSSAKDPPTTPRIPHADPSSELSISGTAACSPGIRVLSRYLAPVRRKLDHLYILQDRRS